MERFLKTLRQRLGPLGWGALVVFAITRLADGLYFLTKIVLGRWLSDVDFGAVEPVLSIRTFAMLPIVVLSEAMSKSISRFQERGELARKNKMIADLVRVTVIGSLLSVVVVYLFKPLILSRLALPMFPYIWIMAAIVAFGLWEPVCLAIIRGERAYRLLNVPHVISPLIGFLLTVLLVGYLTTGLAGALTARALAWLAVGVMTLLLIKGKLRGEKESYADEYKVIKKTIVPMAILVTSMTLLVHFDRLFVRNFLTADSGGYGAIVTLGYIPSLLIGPIAFVILPLASAEHAASRNLNRLYRQSLALGLAITACCTIGYVLFGHWALSLWNPRFSPYSGLLGLYGLVMGIDGIVLTLAYIETACHRYRYLWFLVVPTVAMCAALYAHRYSISLVGVVVIIAAARLLVLVGMLAHIAMARSRRLSEESGDATSAAHA